MLNPGLRLHVGSYAVSGGGGLYPLSIDDGRWAVGMPERSIVNASFGVRSPLHGLHYFVDESDDGAIGIFRRGEQGWRQAGRMASGGSAPCYVALNPGEDRLAVANYESGSLALFRLGADGLPAGAPLVRRHRGSGPNRERQASAHAHCAVFSPDGAWLFQVDLGADEILAFPMMADDPLRNCSLAYRAPDGSGPRHLVFSPDGRRAYLVSELASTLTVLAHEKGIFTEMHRLSTLPLGYEGESLGGHIGLNAAGDRVYVTNRGHDSVATFALDGERPTLLQHIPCGGASPRFFHIVEEAGFLAVANEESGSVAIFDIAPDGTLSLHAVVPVPGAAFIAADG